jgi:hypothetical protein
MKRIKEETRIAPELFDSPQSLRVRMRAVNDYLKGESEALKKISDDTNMPVTNRREALQTMEAINRFIGVLGVPEETSGLSKEDLDLINKYPEDD